MSAVVRTSAISIFCDCPYAGKIREVKESPEREEKRKVELLKSLKDTKDVLAIARHDLVNTRHKLALLKRILNLELGYDVVNPHILIEPTWKNRIREVSYLKSEQIKLVDYLRECDPRYRTELDIYPTRLSASTEDLLTAVQEKTLKHLYHGYTVYHSGLQKQLGSSLWEFFQLKQKYENTLYHNKVMGREIDIVKEKIIWGMVVSSSIIKQFTEKAQNQCKKISNFQRQFLENKNLIDYITDHHFTMVGCFSHAFPKITSSEEDNESKSIEDSEALKYKKLWEDSELQKRTLLDKVDALKNNLDNVKERIIRAEISCSQNIIKHRILAEKLKGGTILTKLQPKRKEVFGEFSLIHYRSRKSQLEAAVNENKYLKAFLKKAILSKTEDLKQYQQSLQSTTEKYRSVLENIRNEILEKEKEKKEKEAAAEKETKKKKKK